MQMSKMNYFRLFSKLYSILFLIFIMALRFYAVSLV